MPFAAWVLRPLTCLAGLTLVVSFVPWQQVCSLSCLVLERSVELAAEEPAWSPVALPW